MSYSEMSFNELLIAVSISSTDEYIKCIRSTLKMNKIFIKRSPNATFLNNYNRKITSMFRSNMDIQFIIDPHAFYAYMIDYINKADKGMSKVLNDIYEKHKKDSSSNSFDLLVVFAS